MHTPRPANHRIPKKIFVINYSLEYNRVSAFMIVAVSMVQSWWSNWNIVAINGASISNYLPFCLKTVHHTL